MVDWAAEGKVMPDFAKLENQMRRQGARHGGDLPPWAARQQKVFTNWINNKIADRPLVVRDLFEDLQDGTVLHGLLEVLSKQSLGALGKVKPERNKIKKIANMNTVWKYLSNTVKLVGIGPTDIVDGNVTLTLGMIWSLIVFFMAKDLGDAGDGLNVLKKRIMEWMRQRTRDYPDVCVTDFSGSLSDGRAFLAVLNDYDPEASPYEPTDSSSENLRRAFEDLRKLYGVGSILDPDDPQCCADEKATITYLAEVMKAMPRTQGEEGKERRRKSPEERREAIDPRKTALKRAEKLLPRVLENLRELCAFGPDDGEACATKVAEIMTSAGLEDVKIVKPSEDREDPSMHGSPFVVGEKPGPPGTPLVLFYSSYGTMDESSTPSPTPGEPGEAGEEGGSSPLCLSPPPALPDDGSSGERLCASGVSQDKANVACQIAAVEALLRGGTLPCGVKVIVGATPPSACLEGNASLEVADRMADFLRAHPALTGLPDIIVVSEPSGARLAPGKHAILVGCRGFASMRLTVSTLNDEQGKPRRCADYGGPVIDPARVLSRILASMHDHETGALKVEGLFTPPEAASLERVKGIDYDEAQLRADTGYSSEVVCAQEVYSLDGAGNQPTPASVVEHLTLLPAVTVTSISTASPPSSNGKYGGNFSLLGSVFPSAASAEILLCLPPGREYPPAVKALQAHCHKHAPHGAQVRFERIEGRSGWQAPAGVPLLSSVLDSLRGEEGEEGSQSQGENKPPEGRETVVAFSPGFSAVPCAFARALPTSSVIGVGVNDPESRAGTSNENILVDDLKLFVQSAVRVVHGVAKQGGNGEKVSAGSIERKQDRPLSGVAYTHRFVDDMERRNALNQLRGKRSNASSPAGLTCPSPVGAFSRGFTDGSYHSNMGESPVKAPTSPLFNTLERSPGAVGGSSTTLTPNHPLSPRRSTAGSLGWGTPPRSPARASDLPQLKPHERGSFGPRVPELPPAPSAAMAAFAAATLGQAGADRGYEMGVPSSSRGAVVVESEGQDGDEKVGGGTPETILAEINELRADPREYAKKLEGLLQYYDKSMYNSPTAGPPVQTTEGTKPLLEAIEMLKATPPLEALEVKEGMQQAAADHVKDLATTNRTGHSGSDGSGAGDRMNRYGQFFEVAGEVCSYFDATASGIVAQLVVSDGERSRHNRKALLAKHFKVCGVAISAHPTVGVACVITLAGGYGPRPLSSAADVVCMAGKKPSAEFRQVVESVPVPQITAEVAKCLKVGMEVQLQYSPGKIKVTFVQASGARKSMSCSWA
ncbi:unnamed protein product [Ascophyllum nodosum]